MKVKSPDLYKELISDEINAFDLLERFKTQPGASNLLLTNYGTALEAYIVTCKSHSHNYDEISSKYQEVIGADSSSKEEKQRAQRILEIIKDFDWNGGIGSLGYLLKKIEIASRFKA